MSEPEPDKRRRRVRRPRVAGGRPFSVQVTLTAEEKAYVAALADAQGISEPAVFLRAAFAGGTDAAAKLQRLRDDLSAARRLLAANSRNLNQIVRAVHAGAEAAELSAALASTRLATERLDAIVRKISQ